MARKRFVAKLRQVDVLVSQGQNMVDAIHAGAPRYGIKASKRVVPFAPSKK